MRSSNLSLGQILDSPSQFVIPVFQRYYRWDQPQWDKLWSDLIELQQPEKTGRHFLGFLVLIPETAVPGKITTFHLIDGQQRLTTLSLLLCALRDVAKASGHEQLAEEIEFTTLKHRYRRGNEQYRLFPKMQDRDHYLACVRGEPPEEGRLGLAVRHFSDRLSVIPSAGTEEALRGFLSLLTQRLEFVSAQLEGENPFNIFKSLNSTGVPLGQADLIRNYVFMQLPVEEHDEFQETLWKPIEVTFEDEQGNVDEVAFASFLRNFLMSRGDYTPVPETFDTFQRRYAIGDIDPRRVAYDLKKALEWHAILRGDRPDPDDAVESALQTLRQFDSATTHPLLFNLYERRDRKQLDSRDLEQAIQLLSGFIVRRLVCGDNSRAYARLFVQACSSLGENAIVGLKDFLEERGHPDTPAFLAAFSRFNLYKSRYRKEILEAIERANEHKEPADLSNAQVEHVMPQTLTETWKQALGKNAEQLHARWLHTPGNLTLTGYNGELSNKSFEEKRKGYNGSNFVITRQLGEVDRWGEAEIQKRCDELGLVASKIWVGPAQPVQRVQQTTRRDSHRFDLRFRYWTGFREYVEKAGAQFTPSKPGTYYSLRCGSFAPGVTLFAYYSLRFGWVSVSVLFNGNAQRQAFQRIREYRDTIESEVGTELEWIHGKDLKVCEVVLRNRVDPTDEAQWPSYYDWMTRSLETLRRVIGQHIEQSRLIPTPSEKSELSATKVLYREYWTALREHLIHNQSVVKPQKPHPQHWTNFSVGRSGFYLSAIAVLTTRQIGVDLVIESQDAKTYFRRLLADRDAIESELGLTLDWRELPDRKQSHLSLRRENTNPSNREDWPEQHAWLHTTLDKFHRVLAPRVKELPA